MFRLEQNLTKLNQTNIGNQYTWGWSLLHESLRVSWATGPLGAGYRVLISAQERNNCEEQELLFGGRQLLLYFSIITLDVSFCLRRPSWLRRKVSPLLHIKYFLEKDREVPQITKSGGNSLSEALKRPDRILHVRNPSKVLQSRYTLPRWKEKQFTYKFLYFT